MAVSESYRVLPTHVVAPLHFAHDNTASPGAGRRETTKAGSPEDDSAWAINLKGLTLINEA